MLPFAKLILPNLYGAGSRRVEDPTSHIRSAAD